MLQFFFARAKKIGLIILFSSYSIIGELWKIRLNITNIQSENVQL